MLSAINFRIVTTFFAGVLACQGVTIFDSGFHSLNSSDPQQTGRVVRDNVLSDWSTPKDFPGVINPGSNFYYEAFVIPNITLPYIQIDFYDVNNSAATFAAAYLNAYLPGGSAPNYGLNTNYLGDGGASGNFGPGNPRSFQVLVPTGNNLVVEVSSTGSALNPPFQFLVEGFFNSNFSNVPGPATAYLLPLSALIAGGWALARRSARVPQNKRAIG